MAKGLFSNGAFKAVDAFGKTMEEVKIKTRTGGLLTMLSAALILSLSLMEFIDYRRLYTDTSVMVDRSRGEKISLVFNVTFPRIPCYLASVDITDISGELQRDISHNIMKTRLQSDGSRVFESVSTNELKSDLMIAANARGETYCGSCYGGVEPESGCCNNCDEVRTAYLNRGWSFTNPDAIEQCVSEHWTEKIQAQSSEGCNVAGRIKVNKVVGNLLFSTGRSFQVNSMNIHDMVPYLKGDNQQHHWGHTVNSLSFESVEEEYKVHLKTAIKEKLGLYKQPLDRHFAVATGSEYMFQYFLKVVGTRYKLVDGKSVATHQYSVTTYERDLSDHTGTSQNAQGLMASRGNAGQPGAFFNFEISPMVVMHTETRQSFAHFVTSTCAIVGGVLTIASLLDSFLFNATKNLKKSSSSSSGYTGGNGKLL